MGELLVAGRESNFEAGRLMNYVYFTATLDAAVWGAELASGEDRGRTDVVGLWGTSRTTPMSRTRSSPGIRRSPSAAANRCASSRSSSTGSDTRPRSSRQCGPDSIPCSRRERDRSRTDVGGPRRDALTALLVPARRSRSARPRHRVVRPSMPSSARIVIRRAANASNRSFEVPDHDESRDPFLASTRLA